jgi:hypothetical protein
VPFVKTIGKHQAALFLKGTVKKWFGGDRFGAGVDACLDAPVASGGPILKSFHWP